jgi:hypothetical protein
VQNADRKQSLTSRVYCNCRGFTIHWRIRKDIGISLPQCPIKIKYKIGTITMILTKVKSPKTISNRGQVSSKATKGQDSLIRLQHPSILQQLLSQAIVVQLTKKDIRSCILVLITKKRNWLIFASLVIGQSVRNAQYTVYTKITKSKQPERR